MIQSLVQDLSTLSPEGEHTAHASLQELYKHTKEHYRAYLSYSLPPLQAIATLYSSSASQAQTPPLPHSPTPPPQSPHPPVPSSSADTASVTFTGVGDALQPVSPQPPVQDPILTPFLASFSLVKCYVREESMKAHRVWLHPFLNLDLLQLILKPLLHTTPQKIIIHSRTLDQGSQLLFPYLSPNLIINVVVHPPPLQPTTLKFKDPLDPKITVLTQVPVQAHITHIKQLFLTEYVRDGTHGDLGEFYLSYAGQLLRDESTVRDNLLSEQGIIYVLPIKKYLRSGNPPKRELPQPSTEAHEPSVE